MLEITITKEDIEEYGYGNSDNCAITRALARAGRSDLQHNGFGIVSIEDTINPIVPISNPIVQKLSDQVEGMSKFAGLFYYRNNIPSIPPETLTVQLPID